MTYEMLTSPPTRAQRMFERALKAAHLSTLEDEAGVDLQKERRLVDQYFEGVRNQPLIVGMGSSRSEHPDLKTPIVLPGPRRLMKLVERGLILRQAGISTGFATSGWMGTFLDLWEENLKDLTQEKRLTQEQADEARRRVFGVPLALKTREKEPRPDLPLAQTAPDQRLFTTRPDFLYLGQVLAVFYGSPGLGTKQEFCDSRINHQMRKLVTTPYSCLQTILDLLGIKSGNPAGDVFPHDIVVDHEIGNSREWMWGGFLLDSEQQLRHGTVSPRDFYRMRVIRIGKPDGEPSFAKHGLPLLVNYFSTETDAADFILRGLDTVYTNRARIFASARQLPETELAALLT